MQATLLNNYQARGTFDEVEIANLREIDDLALRAHRMEDEELAQCVASYRAKAEQHICWAGHYAVVQSEADRRAAPSPAVHAGQLGKKFADSFAAIFGA